MEDKKWEIILEEDENGDVILPFPDELIAKYDWREGDSIKWDVKDGYAILTNISAEERNNAK